MQLAPQTPEQWLLRSSLANRKLTEQAFQEDGIVEQTYYRWPSLPPRREQNGLHCYRKHFAKLCTRCCQTRHYCSHRRSQHTRDLPIRELLIFSQHNDLSTFQR